MAYQALFKPSFLKDIKKIPDKIRARFEIVIDRIIKDPFSVNAKKLVGHTSLFRYRLGDYRLVYYVQKHIERIVFLVVTHRKDVYKLLKRKN